MKDKYYIVPIFGCVDPDDLKGPYKTFTGMRRAARKIRAKQDENDALFWLKIGKRNPYLGSFTSDELGVEE